MSLQRTHVAVELARLRGEERALEQSIATGRRQLATLENLRDFLGSREFKLERNEASRFHKLAEDCIANRVIDILTMEPIGNLQDVRAPIFLVRQDWAAVLGDQVDAKMWDIRLPFPECIFEMRINGRAMILHAKQEAGDQPKGCPFLECGNGYWYSGMPDDKSLDGLWLLSYRQVIATCIVMDAGLTTTEQYDAPHALNKKRERSGKPPLQAYHVVDLVRRPRAAEQVDGGHSDRARPRLHFRRGHWRHLEGRQTWIRWTMVGDPDLGSIAKHYTL